MYITIVELLKNRINLLNKPNCNRLINLTLKTHTQTHIVTYNIINEIIGWNSGIGWFDILI